MQTTMLPPTMGGRLVVLPLVSWYIRGVGPPFGAATGRCRLTSPEGGALGPLLDCKLFFGDTELYVCKLALELYLAQLDAVVRALMGSSRGPHLLYNPLQCLYRHIDILH